MIGATVLALSALLFAAALLFSGHGLQATLVPLVADAAGYSRFSIGLLWSAYAAGLMAGSILCGRIIIRVGHIRTFAALTAAVAAIMLLYAFVPSPSVWFGLRFLHGFLIAGVFMTIESWLNDKSTDNLRGLVMSVYSALSLLMISIGQLMINVVPPSDGRVFSLAGFATLIALIPVALTKSSAPPPVTRVEVNLKKLWQSSRVAVIGSAASGLTTSAYWGLGPVFGQGVGMTSAEISLYLSATVIGGALCQWVLGRLSDYIDRRRVAAFAGFGAALCGIAMTLAATRSFELLLLACFFFGAFAFSISSLCIAMASDRADPSDFVAISGGLLFVFSAGSVSGSMVGSVVMDVAGSSALYLYTAVIHGALGVIALVMTFGRPPVPPEEKREFRPVPTTSPEAYAMDPRGEG